MAGGLYKPARNENTSLPAQVSCCEELRNAALSTTMVEPAAPNEKATAKAKKPAIHPKYSEMIVTAITALKTKKVEAKCGWFHNSIGPSWDPLLIES